MRTETVLHLRRVSVIILGSTLVGCTSFVSLGASNLSDGSTSDGACLAEVGCDGSVPSGGDVYVPEAGAADAMSPCDPLAPLPTKLGVLLGVGQDSNGTLYVADTAPDGQNRVFVSDGNTLYRQHILGSGQSGTAQYSFEFESADSDGSDARDLLLDATGGQATAMALAPPVGKLFLTPGAPGMTSLNLADASAVDGMNVVNLPATVDYFGDVSNGDVIILTVPKDAYSSANFRVYYGPSDNVVEYAITTFNQSMSGDLWVTFSVGSSVYTMQVSTVYERDAGLLGEPGPGTLAIAGGATLSFTLRSPAPTSLAGLTFTCLSPSSASWTQPVDAAALSGAVVTPCPVGYVHPSVCCQGALNQKPVCTESPDAPFQGCASTSLTYPDPNKCCSLATDTGCFAPDSDAAVPVEGEASVSDCFYPCGPGGYPVALLPADSPLSGEQSCASLDNPWSGAQGECLWCCTEGGGCPTNQFSCPINSDGGGGCANEVTGAVCDACPSGWRTPKGGQYDLCCQANSQGGTDCFSVANSISPN